MSDDDCEHDERGERGKRGHRGHRGHDGESGPPGAAGGGDLLKFTGLLRSGPIGVPVVSYLADSIITSFIVPPGVIAPSYPAAVVRALRNLAVNVSTIVPLAAAIVVELLKNGAPVPGFIVAYGPGEIGVKFVVAGPISYGINDRIDLRVTSTSLGELATNVSATVGVE